VDRLDPYAVHRELAAKGADLSGFLMRLRVTWLVLGALAGGVLGFLAGLAS
jgi:hypothetical protein